MSQHQRSALSQFVSEMRRRHLARFAIGYLAAAFVVLQLAEIVFPAFGMGELALRVLVIVVALGFLPSVVLAWIFDITVGGIKRTEGGPADGLIPRLALLVVTVGVVGGLTVFMAGTGVFEVGTQDGNDTPFQFAAYDPSIPIRSIAVLPLEDFSPDGSQRYFTAGMHEELIAKLSQLEELRVVSRTSVMQYAGTTKSAPQIGRELGVDALIEGSVNRSEDQVRITLQIIHAASDSHIQTLQFDREVGNALALQTEVAHAVAREIDSEHDEEMFDRTTMNASPGEDAYLMGKYEYDRGTPEGYRMAFEYFSDALKNDPNFAPAMAGLAGARFLVDMEDGEIDPGELEMARSEAAEALAMDTHSIEAMEVFSYIERSIPLVISAGTDASSAATGGSALRVLKMPGTPDPITVDISAVDTEWLSAESRLGQRLEEQIRRRAMRGGVADGQQQALAARQLMGSGRFMEARGVLEDLVAASPHIAPAWEMLTRSEVFEDDVAGAVAVVTRWQQSGAPGAPGEQVVARLRDMVEQDGVHGFWHWTIDRLEAGQDEGRDVQHAELAAAYAGAGNHAAALEQLDVVLEGAERGLLTLRWDPVWDDLRRDERFKELVRQVRSAAFSPTIRRGPSGREGRGSGRGNGR